VVVLCCVADATGPDPAFSGDVKSHDDDDDDDDSADDGALRCAARVNHYFVFLARRACDAMRSVVVRFSKVRRTQCLNVLSCVIFF